MTIFPLAMSSEIGGLFCHQIARPDVRPQPIGCGSGDLSLPDHHALVYMHERREEMDHQAPNTGKLKAVEVRLFIRIT